MRPEGFLSWPLLLRTRSSRAQRRAIDHAPILNLEPHRLASMHCHGLLQLFAAGFMVDRVAFNPQNPRGAGATFLWRPLLHQLALQQQLSHQAIDPVLLAQCLRQPVPDIPQFSRNQQRQPVRQCAIRLTDRLGW